MLQAVYGRSPVAAVMDCYPEHDWKEWLFPFVPVGFWRKLENRRRYLKWLEGQLGFSGPEDWYQVTHPDFFRHCGTGLLNGNYRASVLRAVRELYPDYDWCEWLFRGPPKGLWKQAAVRKRYLAWLAERLWLRRPADWYRVTRQDFQNHGGGHLLQTRYSRSVFRAARELHPNFGWRPERFVEHGAARRRQVRR